MKRTLTSRREIGRRVHAVSSLRNSTLKTLKMWTILQLSGLDKTIRKGRLTIFQTSNGRSSRWAALTAKRRSKDDSKAEFHRGEHCAPQ